MVLRAGDSSFGCWGCFGCSLSLEVDGAVAGRENDAATLVKKRRRLPWRMELPALLIVNHHNQCPTSTNSRSLI
jgi:hypothetical protein